MPENDTVCCRLHPRHIHRAYAPLNCVAGRMWRGGGALHTTKPVGVEHPTVDTLSTNVRCVLPLRAKAGVFFVVFVGGPLIGSIRTEVEEGRRLQCGEEIAHFEYGGSAIYILLPRSFPPVQWRLPMNAPLSEAEGVKLRSLLGEIVADDAVADLGFESL